MSQLVKKSDQDKKVKDANELSFIFKFKLNKRTLTDLCNQIESDENKNQKESGVEEVGTSDGGVTTDGAKMNSCNAYGSDDEANDAVLQKIHGNILGVLTLNTGSSSKQ